MALGISGIGASQFTASPHVFGALSVAGRPQPLAPSSVAPNAANLTLAAQPAFDALVRIGAQGKGPITFQLQGPLPTGVPALSNLRALASIVRTVTNLASARVYPSAIFSFHA